jgi:hypothetical protein
MAAIRLGTRHFAIPHQRQATRRGALLATVEDLYLGRRTVLAAYTQDIQQAQFDSLVDCKAWEQLGLTGPEFSQRWLRGDYNGSTDPTALAMTDQVLAHHWAPRG